MRVRLRRFYPLSGAPFAACDDETREAVNRGFLFACEDASMQVIKFICETKKERR